MSVFHEYNAVDFIFIFSGSLQTCAPQNHALHSSHLIAALFTNYRLSPEYYDNVAGRDSFTVSIVKIELIKTTGIVCPSDFFVSGPLTLSPMLKCRSRQRQCPVAGRSRHNSPLPSVKWLFLARGSAEPVAIWPSLISPPCSQLFGLIRKRELSPSSFRDAALRVLIT